MATDMGMINDFIQKKEEVKEELFSGTKHHCIFEITHPNKHSECYFCKLVQDFKEDQEGADMMCESIEEHSTPFTGRRHDNGIYFRAFRRDREALTINPNPKG